MILKAGIAEFLALALECPVLDVRSPGEYAHAHIPGAYSLPLFSDEERKVVGTAYKQQSREVAIKIGLDYFEPSLCQSPLREKQEYFFHAQLRLARRCGLPVVLHVRRAVDRVLKHLRDVARQGAPWSGIAHAFNGSEVQAQALLAQGLHLGFGGALTYARATQLRHLARTLPDTALVLETDAPDIAPQWLYVNSAQRQAGVPQGRNAPAELPEIGAVLAQLRGTTPQQLAAHCVRNTGNALPRLARLLV